MSNQNTPNMKEEKRKEDISKRVDELLEELRKNDEERIPSFEEFMKARNKWDCESSLFRRKDVVFTEEEQKLFRQVKERIDAWYTNAESKVEGGTIVTRSYIEKLTEIMNNITFADANNKTQLVEFLSLLLEQCEKADAE